MQIRRYVIGEELILRQLLFDTVHRINIHDYSQDQVDAWASVDYDEKAWIDRLMKSQPWVAVEAGELVGFAEMDAKGKIECFYVHYAWQGRGAGGALLEKIELKALDIGLSRLEVEASITARGFFQRKGFELIRRQQVDRGGVILSNFLMAKQIR